jgi:hypothetical protein
MPHEGARFEYRVFARDLGLVEHRIRALGGAPQINDSAEFYLVSAPDETHNVKIRDGRLDIKVLVQTVRGLEQWEPRFKIPFPIADSALAKLLATSLGVTEPLPVGAGSSVERLVSALRRGRHGVVVAELFKRRSHFLVDDCIAELVAVTVNGAPIRTACVESTEPGQVHDAAQRLGLDVLPNISYLAAVRHLAGLASNPEFERFARMDPGHEPGHQG